MFTPQYSAFFKPLLYTDEQGYPFIVQRTNIPYQVVGGHIILAEIPDASKHVYINGMYEIDITDTISDVIYFKVNYDDGEVLVDSSLEGTTITVKEYWGRGILRYWAQRTQIQDTNNYFAGDNVEDALKEAAERINNLILNTANPAEVTDAHLDSARNTTYSVLKNRLDTDSTDILDLQNNIGNPANLTTTDKTVVGAINENKSVLAEKANRTNSFTDMNEVKYIAHRGGGTFAPENTLPAFEMAGILGYWGAECDIQETSDNEIVIFHDDTIDRMTDGTGTIPSLTLAQVKTLNIDSGANIAMYPGTKVPTLEEYLKVCKKWNIVPIIEIKDKPLSNVALTKFIDLLNQYGLTERCIVISFETDALDALRSATNKIIIAPLLDITQDNINYVKSLGNSMIDCSISSVTVANIKLCHENDINVIVWTIDNPNDLDTCIACGINFITTNELLGGM